jgi:hypothetical protein
MTRATTTSLFAAPASATALAAATLVTATLTVATLTVPGPAQAAPYWPWCAQNYDRSNAHYCGFVSWEQCMDTVRGGRGGHCYHNLESPPAAVRSARTRHY